MWYWDSLTSLFKEPNLGVMTWGNWQADMYAVSDLPLFFYLSFQNKGRKGRLGFRFQSLSLGLIWRVILYFFRSMGVLLTFEWAIDFYLWSSADNNHGISDCIPYNSALIACCDLKCLLAAETGRKLQSLCMQPTHLCHSRNTAAPSTETFTSSLHKPHPPNGFFVQRVVARK